MRRSSHPLAPFFRDVEQDAVTFLLSAIGNEQPPVFMGIDSKGMLSINAAVGDQGDHRVNVTCSDLYGQAGSAVITVTVLNRAPVLVTPRSPASAQAGTPWTPAAFKTRTETTC